MYTTVLNGNTTFNGVVLANVAMCLSCEQPSCIRCRINQTAGAHTVCEVCASPYVLFDNMCLVACPNSSYTLIYNEDKLEWECQNTTQIIRNCNSRSMLTLINSYNQSICVNTCPTAYYTDYGASMCQACAVGCDTCTNSSICLTC